VQTAAILGLKRGFLSVLLTGNFLYSIETFLTDAPLAQLAEPNSMSGCGHYYLFGSSFEAGVEPP
jgi:hypothetical protein